MASSTQFSIRGLLILTAGVAIVTAVVAPWIRDLQPQERLRAAAYLLLIGVVVGAVVGKGCISRRRIEKVAGPLVSRSGIGGNAMRWASFAATLPLSILAVYGVTPLAKAALFVNGPALMMSASFSLFCGFAAAGLGLHWWWGTGFFVTEACENGLVLRGLVFRAWSELVSFAPSRQISTILVVNVLTRRGRRPVRIRVAAKDRAEWERILAEHGVPLAESSR